MCPMSSQMLRYIFIIEPALATVHQRHTRHIAKPNSYHDDKNRINATSRKAMRRGLTLTIYSLFRIFRV